MVEFDPVVPKLTRFDPVVPKLKLNLILSFQIERCRPRPRNFLEKFPTQSSTPWRRPGETPAPIRAPPKRVGIMRHLLRVI
jgi:hypothetical protein